MWREPQDGQKLEASVAGNSIIGMKKESLVRQEGPGDWGFIKAKKKNISNWKEWSTVLNASGW